MSLDVPDLDRLAFSEVSRDFGRRRAVRRVSFECQAGEVLGLLGPNGAGKSTVLAIAATVLRPSSGEVRFGSRPAVDWGSGLRSRLGLLTHELQLYPELTARENLEFFAGLHGLTDPRRAAFAALEAADLAARADDLVGGLSRGMRQRIALERTLLHRPRLVLLDEPFTGLDQASNRALMERLRDLASTGSLVIVATHDLDIADALVHRAVLLDGGRLVQMDVAGGTLADRYRAALASAAS